VFVTDASDDAASIVHAEQSNLEHYK